MNTEKSKTLLQTPSYDVYLLEGGRHRIAADILHIKHYNLSLAFWRGTEEEAVIPIKDIGIIRVASDHHQFRERLNFSNWEVWARNSDCMPITSSIITFGLRSHYDPSLTDTIRFTDREIGRQDISLPLVNVISITLASSSCAPVHR